MSRKLCFHLLAHIPQVVFFDPASGSEQAVFDHGGDDEARAFGCVAINPAGDAAVVGAFDRLYAFVHGGGETSSLAAKWRAAGVKQVHEGHATRGMMNSLRANCLGFGSLCGMQLPHALTWQRPAAVHVARSKTCLQPPHSPGSRMAPSSPWAGCAATLTYGTRASAGRGAGRTGVDSAPAHLITGHVTLPCPGFCATGVSS